MARIRQLTFALSLCLCSAAGWVAVAHADSLADTFARGNRAFARAEYQNAIDEYEALLEAGVDDPALTYNLASAYGSLGRYGQAIRYFERTLRLDPSDSAARAGLKLARGALGERQAKQTGEAIVTDRPPLTEALYSRLSLDTLSWALLACSLIASLAALSLLFVGAEALRLGLGIVASFASLLALLSGLGLWAKTDWGAPGTRAIITAEMAPLRDGPDDGAPPRLELPEGSAVRVLSREGSYLRVQLGSAGEGFVLAAEVGEI